MGGKKAIDQEEQYTSMDFRHLGEEEGEEEKESYLEPASPTSEYIHTPLLSLVILAVFESEIPVDDSQAATLLRDELLSINTRFSSVLLSDEKGRQKWKRVNVRVEDHIKIPSFPDGLSPEIYDGILRDYLAKIAVEPLSEDRPLWENHIFKYPTSGGAGTIILKLHHALGDGFTLMGTLFSCIKRADDPSLPLTFPRASLPRVKKEKSMYKRVSNTFSGIWNTATDSVWSVLQSTVVEDNCSAIRSGNPYIESHPIAFERVTLSLDRIRHVKSKVGGTVNDVVTGMVFYGIHLYNQRMGHNSKGKRMTSLTLLNTRMINGYQSVKDMLEANTWGNKFTFLQVAVPVCSDIENVNPLNFILEAKELIIRKRNSLALLVVAIFLQLMHKIKGPLACSRYIYTTMKNSSMAITNMTGPTEKIKIGPHPVENLYFLVANAPTVFITVLSYMGKLTVGLTTEKGFVDNKLLMSCINQSFERIYEEACGKGLSAN